MSTINWTDIFLALIGLASDVVTSHKEISLAKLASEEILKSNGKVKAYRGELYMLF